MFNIPYMMPCCYRGLMLYNMMRTSPMSMTKTSFTTAEAMEIARRLGIDFRKEKFDIEQFRMGLGVELGHGLWDLFTNVTGNDPILTGKIALAHLREFPDYYTRLAKLEQEAKAYWSASRDYYRQRVFTLSELAQYDGTMGKPAYVAVNGIVYDVSGNPKWSGVSHHGLTPGKDLSSQFEGCHGAASGVLAKLPKVGVLK